jgi:hypothetical protein
MAMQVNLRPIQNLIGDKPPFRFQETPAAWAASAVLDGEMVGVAYDETPSSAMTGLVRFLKRHPPGSLSRCGYCGSTRERVSQDGGWDYCPDCGGV